MTREEFLMPLAYGSALSEALSPKENAMALRRWWFHCLVLVCLAGVGRVSPAVAEEIVIGGQCDRTGPTKPGGI